MDVVTTLVPDIDTFSSGQVGGIEVDVGYPASVSMPGSQFLPVNDPADPAIFNQILPFERARFTCTQGAALSVNDFTCTVPQEVNAIGGTVPPAARPPCVLTLAAP